MRIVFEYSPVQTAPEGVPIVHCVSWCGKMGAGVARTLNSIFDLKTEFQATERYGPGLVAIPRYNRYILNLITKKYFFGKPTLDDFKQALLFLREFIIQHNCKHVAAPALGTGRDKLPMEAVLDALAEALDGLDVVVHIHIA